MERLGDLRPSERFRNEQHSARLPRAQARIGNLWSIANDDDGKLSVIRMVTHGVKERLAHVVGGTVEHQRIGMMLLNALVNRSVIPFRKNLVATVAQGKRQQLGDLRRVVDEQDAAQP